MTPRLAASWLADLGADAVLEGQGADARRVSERNPRLLAAAERAAREGPALLRPRVACRVLSIRERDALGVTLEGGSRLSGALIVSRLAEAAEAAIVLATLGDELERRVSRMFGRDLPYAFALDAFGSAAVEALVRGATRHLRDRAARTGAGMTRPVSPGMDGFALAPGQREIFAVLGDGAAGVTLLSSGGMTPRKSVSLVYGLGRAAEETGGICDPCPARPDCRFRALHATGA
jgi:hypothetical protein